ncbi:reverse transcriptase domain-containing protein [Tanacetum coccineum]|uniref:Reverse transcriptase domain-containing protein n=1 Tax=Tanacetum coccineum TaxID=301880 RepID=A0ABQ4XQE3_9ASTR
MRIARQCSLRSCPKNLETPEKFLIPCNFPELDDCLALADLGASINLMPLSVWKKLSLRELTLTRMTLELANRSVAIPVGVAEDVFVKVGKMVRALIDVHGKELTLRVNDEAITFKVEHTSRYSRNYYDETVYQVNVIDVACEEYAQEVLGFLDSSTSGNPTPSDPIIASSSPSFTPFEGGDFILEEIEACLSSDSIPPGIDDADFDPKGDIRLLEKLLNDDPSSPLPPKELIFEELKMIKSSINDPPKLEVKDLPSHLEYTFLEGTDKLPVIISKELKDEEKAALLKVLKSHKRAIAWKISDIKGIDPRFCTHKILMEDDFKPAVQHQRRVNPKIHEVIKILDAGLIDFPYYDFVPWCRVLLVTGWRVCIDYRKLNDATRKDHFPLPFMDQMLERLAGNEYYCFLDGFSGYFQIPIDPQDQEKTTFTCPYGTFAYRRMPFGLCNASGTFQRAKVDVIAKLPHPTSVKGVRSFLGHAGFYRRFIQDFSKIARPMTHLLEKETPFIFSKECTEAFNLLKKKLTEALILVAPDWDLTFEIMCDASDYAVGAVLGQRKTKHFQPIHYASNTMTDAQAHYTTTKKELLAAVYAFEKFRPYLGIDFMGLFPSSRGNNGNKYILVAVDYLSKWVEAKALPTNDARVVVKFLKSLFAQFGTPRAIISDRGTYFCNDQFAKVMFKYGVTYRLSTVYHHNSGNSGRFSKSWVWKVILERTISENHTLHGPIS